MHDILLRFHLFLIYALLLSGIRPLMGLIPFSTSYILVDGS